MCFCQKIGLRKLQFLTETCTQPRPWQIKSHALLNVCKDHPDQQWYERLRKLLILKFSFKMDPKRIHLLTPSRRINNHKSTQTYAEAVDLKIIEKLENGSWYCDDTIQFIQVIQIKMVPQKDKIRMVLNYSDPYDGVSVNSIVPDEAITVELPTFRDTCEFAYGENNNILYLGKIDLKSAFDQIALNADERKYGVYAWRGHLYVENSMPPGTRAAVQAMHDFGIALRYAADKQLSEPLRGNSMGYVDDNMFRGRSRLECIYQVVNFIDVCRKYNVRINVNKTIFAEQIMLMLGNEFNQMPMYKHVKLDDNRLISYSTELVRVYHSISKPRYEMDSILGKLFSTDHFAWPLKALTRPFIDLLPKNTHTKLYNKNEMLEITDEIKRHIELWLLYLPMRHSVKIKNVIFPPTIQVRMHSDASNIGGGACTGTHYTMWKWADCEVHPNDKNNTPELELKAIEGGLYAFRQYFANKKVLLEVDSQTAQKALIKKDSKNRAMWKVIKRIALYAIKNNTRWYVKWIPRDLNADSDALSKLELDRFYRIKNEAGESYDEKMTQFTRDPANFQIDLNDYTKDIPYGESLGKKK